MSAIGRPATSSASRIRRARSACSTRVPWDMFSLAPSIPASISAASISGDDDAGPIVATIFVQRRRTMLPPGAHLVILGNASQPGNSAFAPSCSSMRRSWLYLATRSERAGAPVLI